MPLESCKGCPSPTSQKPNEVCISDWCYERTRDWGRSQCFPGLRGNQVPKADAVGPGLPSCQGGKGSLGQQGWFAAGWTLHGTVPCIHQPCILGFSTQLFSWTMWMPNRPGSLGIRSRLQPPPSPLRHFAPALLARKPSGRPNSWPCHITSSSRRITWVLPSPSRSCSLLTMSVLHHSPSRQLLSPAAPRPALFPAVGCSCVQSLPEGPPQSQSPGRVHAHRGLIPRVSAMPIVLQPGHLRTSARGTSVPALCETPLLALCVSPPPQ